jgi:hypothetical protein
MFCEIILNWLSFWLSLAVISSGDFGLDPSNSVRLLDAFWRALLLGSSVL